MMKKRSKNIMERKEEDRISDLSDDILTSIICHLTLKEATATAVLSSRWRHLSAYVSHLDFPPFLPKLVINPLNGEEEEEILLGKFRHYIKSIDHVLDCHRGSRVKEFRAEMLCMSGAHIDMLLRFALAKGAETIVLRMKRILNVDASYSLRLRNLIAADGCPPRVRDLSLSCVDVDDSDVELLLSGAFPLLESLSLAAACSRDLRKVSIVGGPPALKHVGICGALYLKSIEIDGAVNLVSLKLRRLGSPISVRINNAPKLVKLSTVDDIICSLPQFFSTITLSVRSQLLTLKILKNCFLLRYPFEAVPEFKSVKHLELKYTDGKVYGKFGLSRFFEVIEACPALEKLEIKMQWFHCEKFKVDDDEIFVFKHTPIEVCRNLKKMKLLGFFGTTPELGLALSILWHAKSLEQILVEAYDVNEEVRGIATARAWHHLLPKIPSSALLQVN
ncbi:hypothetical protein OROHE_003292 [Orobanche hederae]